ncbi:MAG: fibronectin type III domain-containing protein [Bacteroidota bacterium]
MLGFLGCDGNANDPVPEVPRQIYPSNGADNEANATELQWNSAASAVFYQVQVSDRPGFADFVVNDERVVADSYQLSGLAVGELYFWRVRAGNDHGVGEWSETWQFATEKEAVIPPIPKLTLPADGELDQPTQINFIWDPVDGATTYHIQVSLEENFIRRSADVEGVRGNAALIRGLVPTYIYYWRVRSQNPLGFSSWSPTRHLVIEDDLG